MDVIHDLRAAVRAVVEHVDGLHVDTGYTPRAGSKAAADLDQDATLGRIGIETPLANAYSVANMQLASAGDLLIAMHTLLERGGLVTSVVVCARAALEASAQAWWILDPSLSAFRRAGRGAGILYETLRRKLQLPTVDAAAVRQRMDALVSAARAMDVDVRLDKAKVAGIGERPPSKTALTQQLMTAAGNDDLGDSLYRFYSAVAHATPLGLINLMKSSADDPSTVMREGRLSLSPKWQVLLLGFGLQGYGEAVERELAMYGWDDRPFRRHRLQALRLVMRGLQATIL